MKKILALIFVLLGALPLVQAQTLEEYLIEAGENSPSLKARYAEYQAALQRAPQVGALPDPEASFNFFLQPMERYMGNQVGDMSVMQMFPWFGSNQAARDEANYMAQMKFASFIEAKINLYHEVRTVWYQLYLNDQESILMEKELEIMKTLERLALAKYTAAPAGGGAGTTTPARSTTSSSASVAGGAGSGGSGMAGMGGAGSSASGSSGSGASMASGGMSAMGSSGGSSMVDVMLVRLQLKELENQVLIHHEARRPLQVRFNQLLRRRPSMTVVSADTLLPVPLPATLSLIEDSIKSNHPMLKMYEWDEKARESQLRMAQLMGRPMFGVGLNYMIFKPRPEDGMQMGGENMVMPMVTLSLPIYRKKYNAAKKEAEYAQQAATYQKEATERELFTELENLLYQYQSAVSRLKLLKDQTALTEQTIRLLTTNYSVTGTGIDEIIRQRQSLLSYRQQQLQAITDQNMAVSAINRMMQGDN
ncbi:TolC family protein [Pontibacter ramchanderi]|uniref:Outer membrane efflux protein n=1 Tax=Pontibacter ramchanderi TaxID=1179743 RepID=A0A2N3V0N5_9BACT|nr:TolC family protein [Pontibacter ramchanderi]PKV75189.1 outer membrane efflux protein [Pontibacter ramchanderi]